MRGFCIFLAAALLTSVCCAQEAFAPLRVGEVVPVYALQALDGKAVRVGPGQPLTLLNLWATWCAPCRREFPEIQRLQQHYRTRGLRVVAVSIDRGSDNPVRAFIKRVGVTFIVTHDNTGGIERAYRATGVPESFLIARDGRLLWHRVGPLDLKSQELQAALEAALKPIARVSARPGAKGRAQRL
jgi:thiol-disulfide isomerase/thioredoxin